MTCSPQRPDEPAVRTVLRESGLAVDDCALVGSGRASWTYRVTGAWTEDRDEGTWIVQFPRVDPVAGAVHVQSRLMPLVAEMVPFAVPVPRWIATWDGFPVMLHREVPGRGLRSDDRWLELAPMLRALHGVPVDDAARVLEREPTVARWRSEYARFREAFEHIVSPRLGGGLREAASVEFDRFLTGAFDFVPAFVHADLGAEHVLVDPDSARPSGIIDFDWATVGDPALDFVGLLGDLGPDPVRRIIQVYEAPISWERLLFYWWLNPSYPLVYAGEHLDEAFWREALEMLGERLSRLAGLRAVPPR